MKKLSIIVLILAGLISCQKNKPADALLMRVQNNSGVDFSSVTAAGKEFGIVKNGIITAYQPFEKIIEVPGASVSVNGIDALAGYGYCGSPMPPSLQKGKYTLVIFEDTLYATHYNARFVRDE